jgi:hypothetical protein
MSDNDGDAVKPVHNPAPSRGGDSGNNKAKKKKKAPKKGSLKRGPEPKRKVQTPRPRPSHAKDDQRNQQHRGGSRCSNNNGESCSVDPTMTEKEVNEKWIERMESVMKMESVKRMTVRQREMLTVILMKTFMIGGIPIKMETIKAIVRVSMEVGKRKVTDTEILGTVNAMGDIGLIDVHMETGHEGDLTDASMISAPIKHTIMKTLDSTDDAMMVAVENLLISEGTGRNNNRGGQNKRVNNKKKHNNNNNKSSGLPRKNEFSVPRGGWIELKWVVGEILMRNVSNIAESSFPVCVKESIRMLVLENKVELKEDAGMEVEIRLKLSPVDDEDKGDNGEQEGEMIGSSSGGGGGSEEEGEETA